MLYPSGPRTNAEGISNPSFQDSSKVVKIPVKKVPVFRPGKDLKEKVLAVKGKKKAK